MNQKNDVTSLMNLMGISSSVVAYFILYIVQFSFVEELIE
jgi:hypothetical protein